MNKKIFHFFSYCFFRIFGFFVSLFPYKVLHIFGKKIGNLLFFLHKSFRKKTLTNLAIVYGETLSEKQRVTIAKGSFENLAITCLEYFRLGRSKGRMKEIVSFEGGEEVFDLLEQKQGVIFFTGHQANWEIPFLAVTEKYPGIAIGKPIKNKWLNEWLLSIREMHGGKIVMPKNAIRQGMKALKEGKFIGIVGDQALPESPYAYPLMGTRAWTTTAPALLSYRTGSPLVVVTTNRVKGRYIISGSPPIRPDLSQPREQEVVRMMDLAMSYLEKSILSQPEQWLWQHDRWKQQEIDHVKREFRFGFILIILPPDPSAILPYISLLKKIYPKSFLTVFAPEGCKLPGDLIIKTYKTETDLYVRDWRYQFVIDFWDLKRIRDHFLQLGAFKAINLQEMRKISQESDLPQMILKTLVKKECLQTVIL